MGIDKRRNYKVVLDCETAPLEKDGEISGKNMFMYDCGWAVVDTKGRVYETHSYINADIFIDESELMKSAYYADKIPKYWERIRKGEAIILDMYEIRKRLKETCEKYGVDEIYAHNARFDYGALQNTQRWITKSKYRWFFPYGVKICDTLKMARKTIYKMPTYRRFCEKNGFMTNHKTPRPRLTAEVLYRFLSKDLEFCEEHIGLDDVLIEKEIFKYCYPKCKQEDRLLWND